MKILAVSFYNLNSLKGEWQLRFDEPPLAEAGLFAITGPTGAGKSTILDAITVGLYGRVPRHGLNRPEEIMTRHTGNCGAEVTFSARGKSYRAIWGLRRAGDKPDGRLQQPVHQLAVLPEGEIFDLKNREVPEKIAELSGLDFDRFLRSVMLSQGDFAAFLKAGENERGELLEKITGLEIYSEISTAAYDRFQQEETALASLKNQLAGRSPLPEEERGALRERENEIAGKLRDLQKTADNLAEKRRWLHTLDELNQDCLKNRQSLETVILQQQERQSSFDALARHLAWQPFMEELGQLELQENNLAALHEEVAELREKQQETGLSLGRAEEEKVLAEQQLQVVQQVFATAQPLVEKARGLEIQLKNLEEQLERDQAEYQKRLAKQTDLRESLQDLENRQSEHLAEREQAENYLRENEGDARLADGLTLLESLISDRDKNRRRLAELRAEEDKTLREKNALEKEWQEATQKLAAVRRELEELLAGEDGKNALQEVAGLNELVPVLRSLLAPGESRLRLSEDQARLEKELKNLAKELGEKTLRQQALEKDLAAAAERREDLARLVEQGRRLADFEAERARLRKGEPCPLCGSTEHPLARHQMSLIGNDDEERLASATREAESLQAQLTEVDRDRIALQTRAEAQELRIAENRTALAELRKNLSGQLKAAGLPGEATPEDIRSRLEEAEKRRQALNGILDGVHQQRETGEVLEKAESALQSRLEKSRDRLTDLHRLIEGVAENLAEVQARLEKDFPALQMPPSDALADSEDWLEGIRERAQRYAAARTGESVRAAQIEKNAVEITFRQSALAELSAELNKLRETNAAREEKAGQLLGEITTLLDGATPDQYQAKISADLEKGRREAEKTRGEHTRLAAALQALDEQLTRREKALAALEKTVAGKRGELEKALREAGIDTLETLREARLPAAEVKTLGEAQRDLQDRRSALQGVVANLEERLARHREQALTGQNEQELRAEQEALERDRVVLEREISEIRYRLRQDEDLQKEQAMLVEKIAAQEREYQRWAALSGLIGSKSGQVFSRYAQSLTLQRLIALANIHLSRLNDRYRLRKMADSENEGRSLKREIFLQIEIIDRYQADAVRSTNSLSGGESFLVSLALALGLSDLASRRHAIETLFIDEGFGTLDSEALDAALSALENLQASGKMIGIISHVPALKERLSTRIQVQKSANGHSTLSIS